MIEVVVVGFEGAAIVFVVAIYFNNNNSNKITISVKNIVVFVGFEGTAIAYIVAIYFNNNKSSNNKITIDDKNIGVADVFVLCDNDVAAALIWLIYSCYVCINRNKFMFFFIAPILWWWGVGGYLESNRFRGFEFLSRETTPLYPILR